MQNKRLMVWAGSILAGLVIILLVVPGFIDWSKYQTMAQQKVREATGYDLTINGALRMAILPTPHVNISNVIVKKPAQGKEDVFLTFENADVRVAFLPLLAGKVEIASITLEKPVITLVTYKDGTDNFKPVTATAAQSGETTQTQQTTAPASSAKEQDIAIDSLRIEDGRVVIRNDAEGTAHAIGIKELQVKADTLKGPFDASGEIALNDAVFAIDVTTGGYRPGETLPVQLNIKEKDDRATLKWSGVVKPDADYEVQGEMGVGFTDLGAVLTEAGFPVSIPNLGEQVQISGMLTATPKQVLLTNGTLQLGKTRFQTKLNAAGLDKDAKSISALIETQGMLDMDSLMKTAEKVSAQSKKSDEARTEKSEKPVAAKKAPANAGALVPADFKLPDNLKADIQIRARGAIYRNQNTGPLEARITAADGKGDARLTVDKVPGGGTFNMAAQTAEAGSITGSVQASIASLETVLSQWLGVVDKKTFTNPSMPRRIEADADFAVKGNVAAATLKTLSLGEPKVTGTVSYTATARPLVKAKLAANVWTLPTDETAAKKETAKDGEKQDAKAAQEKAEPKKVIIDFDPPQLPFDVNFDVTLGRLNRGDSAVTDIRAVGAYDGKSLSLTTGNATVSGGTVSASGKIGDLKALSGIDIQAGLKTDDLESFVLAMSGSPLSLKQKIGAFTGSVKAKGDRKQMAVAGAAQARGYTIEASGTLDDPFSPDIPGTINIRVRHADLVQAIRVFSPGFGSTTGGSKPVDISGTAKINGKVYSFDNMKGILGGSDIAGALKADLSGSVPAFTADITSKILDVGALVGVQSKKASSGSSSSGSSSATETVTAGGRGQWSREPLDTGFMKSVAADIKLAAGTLMYGSWTISDAKGGVSLKNGTLKVSPISGKLYGGTLDASLDAQTAGAGQPLNIAFKADVSSVDIGPFLQALTSSSKKRADGTGSVKLDIKGSGTSSGALMTSLTGQADVSTKTLVIYGMDIDKLAANIVEAFDGGWKGVLAGVTMEGFSGGQSAFKDVEHTFLIAGGDMAVKNFKLETTSSNALVVTNGIVSFGGWNMNLQSDVQVTQPKDVPVISVRLTGPLNAPQKSVNSQALDNLIRTKLGDQVQDLLGDKLKDSPVGGIVNQFLGGGSTQTAPTAPAAPAQNLETSPDTPAPAAPAPAEEPKKSKEEKILEGVMGILGQ